jgi:hypothetical protein
MYHFVDLVTLNFSYEWQLNRNVCGIEQGEAKHRKYKGLKFGGGDAYN